MSTILAAPPPANPFGPTLAYTTELHMDTGIEPDKLVATHCCFCGQQCGMFLKVKDNQVIGVEPRYDFPFNQGKLCPKGVKRYLQNGHPDRLLHAYERNPSAPGGFSALGYEQAISRVAAEIEHAHFEGHARTQAGFGEDHAKAFAFKPLRVAATFPFTLQFDGQSQHVG